MQNVIYANITEYDLLRLLGIGKSKLEKWKKSGMPCEPGQRFSLSKVLRWLVKQQKEQRARALAPDRLTQLQLAELLNVTRQTIAKWGEAGLPRRESDNLYELRAVFTWLRGYYQSRAAKAYRKKLKALRKKISRNVQQIERFLERET